MKAFSDKSSVPDLAEVFTGVFGGGGSKKPKQKSK